jgi:cytochrome c oxidase assembly factor CtaG
VLYLFLGCPPMAALGALITFAATPLYTPYLSDPRIWGISPLTDQQLGGLIMWIPTIVPFLIAMSAIFFRWVGNLERDEHLAAGEFEDDVALDAARYGIRATNPAPGIGRTTGAAQPGTQRETPASGAPLAAE